MKDEIISLYREYCEEIDNDDLHVTQHKDYKESFSEFIEYLYNGYIIFK